MNQQKLSIFEASLSMHVSSIGLGFLGMPFAFYHLGLYLGIFICFIGGLLSHFANMLYLRVKDLTPGKYASIYEIAYLLFGRSAIFIVCIVMFVSNFVCLLLFYMVLGDSISSLATQVLLPPSETILSK